MARAGRPRKEGRKRINTPINEQYWNCLDDYVSKKAFDKNKSTVLDVFIGGGLEIIDELNIISLLHGIDRNDIYRDYIKPFLRKEFGLPEITKDEKGKSG